MGGALVSSFASKEENVERLSVRAAREPLSEGPSEEISEAAKVCREPERSPYVPTSTSDIFGRFTLTIGLLPER